MKALLYAVVMLGSVLTLPAATYYVATNGLDSRTGLDYWTNAVATISNGVRLAVAGGNGNVVLVSNGVYVLTTSVNLTADVTVQGFGNRESVIVDGNRATRCFYMTNAMAVLSTLTITNGRADSGGGVFLYTGGTITNCLITGNTATSEVYSSSDTSGGGGVFMYGGKLLNSSIIGNVYTNYITSTFYTGGGGVLVYVGGIVSNCLIALNSAYVFGSWGGGGGINTFWSGTILDSVISNNYSKLYGGGLHFGSRYDHLVSNCVIVANQALLNGGGIATRTFYTTGLMTITDCTISNNTTATGVGGGIFHGGSTFALIEKSRIVNNNSWNDAGGVHLNAGGIVDNCVVSANSGDVGQANVGSGGIYCNKGGAVYNSTIEKNKAISGWGGGGIFFWQGGIVSNCIICGNTSYQAGWSGGGAYLHQGGTLVNCLVVSNSSSAYGGVRADNIAMNNGSIRDCTIVSNWGGVLMGPTNTMINSIIYYNSGVDVSASGAATNAFWYCCMPTLVVALQNNITNAPLFLDAASGNYRLGRGSPCINVGTNEAWMTGTVDLDGRPRLDHFSRQVDMGAYEYIPQGMLFKFK